MNFHKLQQEVGPWSRSNFGPSPPWHPLLGAVEEVGELAHAFLKNAQGIRGTTDEHEAAMKDAVGDIVIYLADFVERMGWDLQWIVEGTWFRVRRRDWKTNTLTGGK